LSDNPSPEDPGNEPEEMTATPPPPDPPPLEEPAAVDTPRWFVPVEFVEVALTLPSTHPMMVLEEVDLPHRQLRIAIGMNEGSAIAYASRRIPTPRPLTHQFFTDLMESLDITLETVRITSVTGTSYSAEAVFSSPNGLRSIPCRPSDGICLALRQKLVPPIAVATEVIDEMGYDRDQLPG
jgi:bifunctional DNase/RNase